MKLVTVALALALAQFSARREVVRVDVLVTDNGRIVRGLTAADFDVRDSGIAQQVDLASFEELPLNVALALDMSSSVSGDRLGHLRTAVRSALRALKPADKAGLVTFSHILGLRQELTSDVVRVSEALDGAEPAGQTALVDGVYGALMLRPFDPGRNLTLVFSDGVDTSSWLQPATVVDVARRGESTVYAVTVKDSGDSEFLSDLVEATGGNKLEVGSTQDLAPAFLRILDEFRQRYVISFSPESVPAAGWHPLQVRVKNRRVNVKARAGYFKP
jgi:VWFA-related protein